MNKPNPIKIKPATSAAVVPKRPVIWDCGSTLYDSFELKSFERQLESALTRSNSSSSSSKLQQRQEEYFGPKPGRTQSMPHLTFFNSRRSVGVLNNTTTDSISDPASISTSTSTSPVKKSKKKKKLKSPSLIKQLFRSVFSRSSSSKSDNSKSTTTSPKKPNHNWKDDDDDRLIGSSGSGRWFQLVYEDEDHLVYEKDKRNAVAATNGTTKILSTIPEVPEVFFSPPPPRNYTDEKAMKNHLQQPRRRRWSSSSIVERKSMSDRFTGVTSHELM